MVGFGPQLCRDVSFQVLLHGVRGLSGGQPQPVGYPEHVCVHCNHRLSPGDGGYYIGGFAPYAREAHKFFYARGHFAPEISD